MTSDSQLTGKPPIVSTIDLSNALSFPQACERLREMFERKRSFWQGAELDLKLPSLDLSSSQLEQLRALAAGYEVSIRRVLPEPSKVVVHQLHQESTVLPANSTQIRTAYIGCNEGISLRSGQQVTYPGNLVVMGDLNPGCYIRATGSIIVWGKLCGTVHAGWGVESEDDLEQVFVKSLRMGSPLQIRIGGYSGCDDRQDGSSGGPETARLVKGQIWRFRDS